MLIIILSATFLAYRIFFAHTATVAPPVVSEKSEPTAAAAEANAAAANRPAKTGVTTAPIPEPTPAPAIEMSNEQWTKFVSSEDVKSHLVKRSQTCLPGMSPNWGIAIIPDEYTERPLVGSWKTWVVFTKIPCLEAGQTLRVVGFEKAQGGYAIKLHGTVQVTDIIETTLAEFPQGLFDFYKISRAAGINHIVKKSFRPGTGRETVIHVSDLVPATVPLTAPPLVLPAGLTLKRAELPSLNYKSPFIVDVRSPEEFRAGTISGAVNIPFGAGVEQAATFRPKITGADFLRYSFDVKPFLSHRNSEIVLVGASEHDQRPLSAALVLFDLGFKNMNWIYDGVATETKAK